MEAAGAVLFWLVVLALLGLPYWRICNRTGLSKGVAIIALIPILNLCVPWIIAYSDWPLAQLNRKGPAERPQKGIVYTQSEIENFKRKGLM
jgi:hypothetical protein